MLSSENGPFKIHSWRSTVLDISGVINGSINVGNGNKEELSDRVFYSSTV
jgi:hypothetical protein